jgi:hypothetical protein
MVKLYLNYIKNELLLYYFIYKMKYLFTNLYYNFYSFIKKYNYNSNIKEVELKENINILVKEDFINKISY